jgi:hypothetical protein
MHLWLPDDDSVNALTLEIKALKDALREEKENLQALEDAYKALHKAAQTIYDVAEYPSEKRCPHGNSGRNSGEAWYCDECFEELDMALFLVDVK